MRNWRWSYLGGLALLLSACGMQQTLPQQASVAPSYSLAVTPSQLLVVAQGTSQNYSVTVVPAGGFQGVVQVTPEVPQGLTISPASASVRAGSTVTFQVTALQSGSFTIKFSAQAAGLTPQLVAVPPIYVAPPQSISGYVADGVGGPALQGATVELLSGSSLVATTKTNSQGFYEFLNLPVGSYTLLSPGQTLQATVYQGGEGPVTFAASEVVGVQVVAGAPTFQNLIQLRAASQNLPLNPPTLALTSPVISSGVLNFSFNATAQNQTGQSGQNTITIVTAAIGHDPYVFSLGAYNRAVLYVGGQFGENNSGSASTGSQAATLNLAEYAPGLSGQSFLEVAAVDTNQNRTLLLEPITLPPLPAGAGLSDPVQGLQAQAFTVLDTRAQIYSLQPQAAPQNTQLWVTLTWTPYAFRTPATPANPYPEEGYQIFRSIDGGPYSLIAVLPYTYSASSNQAVNPTTFNDASGSLQVGVPVTYEVRAFDQSSTSPFSQSFTVTPLPPFVTSLQTPQDQATGVSLTPTFSWTTNGVGAAEYFVPVLGDDVQGGLDFCGLAPSSSAIGLVALLQTATNYFNRGFAIGAPCGVIGGPVPANQTYSYTYQPTSYSANGVPLMPPLQTYRAYQWQLFEAVAVNDPNNPTAFSVAIDAGNLFWTYDPFGLNTFDGDQVYTFTTGGN